MYWVVKDKKGLLQGRTITYLASELGYSINHMQRIVDGKQRVKKHLGYLLLTYKDQDSFEKIFERVG